MEQARETASYNASAEGRAKYDRARALELLCQKPTVKQYQSLDQLLRDANIVANWISTGRVPGTTG